MKPRLDGFRALAKHVLETAKRLEAQQAQQQAQQQANKKEQYISAIDIRMRALNGWMRMTWPDKHTRLSILQSIDLTEISRLGEQSQANKAVTVKRPPRIDWAKLPEASDLLRYRLEHRRDDQTGQTRLYALLDDVMDTVAYALYQTTNTTTKEPTE